MFSSEGSKGNWKETLLPHATIAAVRCSLCMTHRSTISKSKSGCGKENRGSESPIVVTAPAILLPSRAATIFVSSERCSQEGEPDLNCIAASSPDERRGGNGHRASPPEG